MMVETIPSNGHLMIQRRLLEIINVRGNYGVILGYHAILRDIALVGEVITGCREAGITAHAHLDNPRCDIAIK